MHSFISNYNMIMIVCLMMNIFIKMQCNSYHFILFFSLFEILKKFLTFLKNKKVQKIVIKNVLKNRNLFMLYITFLLEMCYWKRVYKFKSKKMCVEENRRMFYEKSELS